MYNHRCCGDGGDFHDGDVLASDTLDSNEAHLLLCKIILQCLLVLLQITMLAGISVLQLVLCIYWFASTQL